MQFGVCCSPATAKIAAKAGYDFAEGSVGGLLKPLEPKSSFDAALQEIKAADLPYPIVNCFVPGDLKITGPSVDSAKLKTYVSVAMERAAEAGVKIIVFGSGSARRIPDGFSPETANNQLLAFSTMSAESARAHGVMVVVEPLNRADCNVLNSIADCAALVRKVNSPGLRLLVDSFHLFRDNDSYEDIVNNGDLLAHVHIATVANRAAPGSEACDMSPFFNALAKAHYTGRVSIEGKITNPQQDLPNALAFMKNAVKNTSK